MPEIVIFPNGNGTARVWCQSMRAYSNRCDLLKRLHDVLETLSRGTGRPHYRRKF